MADVSLAQAAYDDLEEIDEYTLLHRGEAQRVAYVSELFRQFDVIAATPGIGRLRPELGEGVHAMPVLEHVVFYELDGSRCHILRVLHRRRDRRARFPEIVRPAPPPMHIVRPAFSSRPRMTDSAQLSDRRGQGAGIRPYEEQPHVAGRPQAVHVEPNLARVAFSDTRS
jgi:toxin ParE1/3/4